MKNLITLTIALLCVAMASAQNGLRFPETEDFIIKTHWHYHFTETSANYKGLNYVVEAGYTGKVYTLIGFESFGALKGGTVYPDKALTGYTSFHGVIGFNLTSGYWEQWNYNAGLRFVRAYRGKLKEKYYRHFMGLEAGVTYFFPNGFGIGIRATADFRQDMEIFNWPNKTTYSSFVTISKKF